MRVLLLTYRNRKEYVPLDLGYVKAYCDKSNNQDEIIVRTYSKRDNIYLFKKKIEKLEPEMIIFFTENLQSTQLFTLRFALKLFSILRTNDKKIKLYLQSYKIDKEYSKEILEEHSYVDMIIRGEPEITIKEILLGKKLNTVKGISYRLNDMIQVNAERHLLDTLDNLPSPYLTNSMKSEYVSKMKQAYVSTSRGCIFNCFYCFRNVRFSRVRTISIKRVLDEIKFLMWSRVESIYIIDDCFFLNQKRFNELVTEISKINKNNKLSFALMCRYEFLSEKNMDLMKKMNVRRIQVGLQTTNLKLLKRLNRNFDEKKFYKTVEYLNKLEIFTTVDLILGLPGDNLRSFKESLDYLGKVNPDQVRVHRLFIHPGTYLDRNLEKYKIRLSYKNRDFSLPVVKSNYSFPSDEIQMALRYIKKVKKRGKNIVLTN